MSMSKSEQELFALFSKRTDRMISSFLKNVLLGGVEQLIIPPDSGEKSPEYWIAYNEGVANVRKFIADFADDLEQKDGRPTFGPRGH